MIVIPKKKYAVPSFLMGFTLLELMIVMIIVGILAALTLPSFSGSQERALGREAGATLKLISAAEKNYRMENGTGGFYGSTDVGAINQNLTLSLVEIKWDYNITTTAAPTPECTGFCFNITANRKTSNAYYAGCTYWLTYDSGISSNPENASRSHFGMCP
jgi:prepilin-type N-terminal cleavage/methylation domain-containing protein